MRESHRAPTFSTKSLPEANWGHFLWDDGVPMGSAGKAENPQSLPLRKFHGAPTFRTNSVLEANWGHSSGMMVFRSGEPDRRNSSIHFRCGSRTGLPPSARNRCRKPIGAISSGMTEFRWGQQGALCYCPTGSDCWCSAFPAHLIGTPLSQGNGPNWLPAPSSS